VAAWWLFFRKPKALTDKHQEVIARALESTNAAAINKVAVAFGAEGHGEVAALLRRRAALTSRAAQEVRADQQDLVDAIIAPVRNGSCKYTRETAERFKRRGLTCTGRLLDDYARGLERSRAIQPVFVPLVGPNGEPEPQPGDGLPPEVPGTGEAPEDIDVAAPPSPNPFDKPMDTGPIPLGSPPVGDWPEAEAGGGDS
jgi:hypothetical protein